MIILDTNVVSEPMRQVSNPAVTAWLDRQVAETLFFTAISLSELLVGIRILPEGKRKDGLEARLKLLLERLFGSRDPAFRSAGCGGVRGHSQRGQGKWACSLSRRSPDCSDSVCARIYRCYAGSGATRGRRDCSNQPQGGLIKSRQSVRSFSSNNLADASHGRQR